MAQTETKLNGSTPLTKKRPPIVVVMGHVDHGKTTLLDYIRKSNVAAKEAGGITQSVGAYEVAHRPQTNADLTPTNAEKNQNQSAGSASSLPAGKAGPRESAVSQRLTFIDTPGHEAFTKMRSRGAKIADIAILVVAADDGVQPQTKEAIKIIQEAKIPYIVAINKIDKNNADVERVKTELTQNGVLLEGFGGSISFQLISAKAGTGVNELLDLILLTAEVEELTYDPTQPGSGVILEAHLDPRSGITATAIIKNGTLRIGDEIRAGEASGKIRGLKNFLKETVTELQPSSPAIIVGFEALPAIGEEFMTGSAAPTKVGVPTEVGTGPKAEKKAATMSAAVNDDKKINFILKANVAGSLEALTEAVKKLKAPDGHQLVIIDEGVGEVSESDAKLALTTGSIIIAFRTKINPAAKTVIRVHAIPVFESEIIYELLDDIKAKYSGEQKKIIAGDLQILRVFAVKGGEKGNLEKQVVGGKVVSGKILNQSEIEIHRRGAKIGDGKIVNLQKGRKDAPTLELNDEGGLLINSAIRIAEGDHLIARTL